MCCLFSKVEVINLTDLNLTFSCSTQKVNVCKSPFWRTYVCMYEHSYKFQLVEIRKENCIIPLIESEPSEIFGNVVQLLIPFSIFLFFAFFRIIRSRAAKFQTGPIQKKLSKSQRIQNGWRWDIRAARIGASRPLP